MQQTSLLRRFEWNRMIINSVASVCTKKFEKSVGKPTHGRERVTWLTWRESNFLDPLVNGTNGLVPNYESEVD